MEEMVRKIVKNAIIFSAISSGIALVVGYAIGISRCPL